MVKRAASIDRRPHSRACGIYEHHHGNACSNDCPSCHGTETPEPEPFAIPSWFVPEVVVISKDEYEALVRERNLLRYQLEDARRNESRANGRLVAMKEAMRNG